MDVFWNDPMCLSLPYFVILSCLTPEFVLVKGKVLDLVFERVNQSICMSTYLWLIVSLDHIKPQCSLVHPILLFHCTSGQYFSSMTGNVLAIMLITAIN